MSWHSLSMAGMWNLLDCSSFVGPASALCDKGNYLHPQLWKGCIAQATLQFHWLKESLNTRLKKEEDDTVYKDSKKVQLLKEGTLISFLIVILYIPDKKEYTEEYMEMESVPFVKGVICSTNYKKKNPASMYCRIYISVFPNPTIGTIKPKNFIFSFKLPETKNIAIYLCNPNIKITYTFLDKQGRNIFLKGTITYQFIAIETYVPNHNQSTFFKEH